MKEILVTLSLEERHKAKLEAAAPDCAFTYATGDALTKEMVQQAQVIIGNPKPSWIAGSERLELLQLFSAGADPYLKPGILAPATALTNATGAYGKAVSEHAFAMTLMLQKKLHCYRDFQHEHAWKDAGMVTSLSDATVLVVGLGDIGLAYAKAFAAVGAKIVFNDINQDLVDRGMKAYEEAGIKAYGKVCDVTNEEQVQAFVKDVEEHVGVIDILVNNAGIIKRIPMVEMSK